jgi:hypothetical protein
MAKTTKRETKLDSEQTLKSAYADETAVFAAGGFLDLKVGHKITQTAVDSVTTEFSYYDNDVLLQTIRIIYTDSTQATMLSAERVA